MCICLSNILYSIIKCNLSSSLKWLGHSITATLCVILFSFGEFCFVCFVPFLVIVVITFNLLQNRNSSIASGISSHYRYITYASSSSFILFRFNSFVKGKAREILTMRFKWTERAAQRKLRTEHKSFVRYKERQRAQWMSSSECVLFMFKPHIQRPICINVCNCV